MFLRLFLHLQYVLWYTHNMMVSKKKVMTKKKKISPVLIFFLTLGGILLVGLSGLLFLSLQTGKRGAQQAWNTDADENSRQDGSGQDDLEGKDNAEGETLLHSLWEMIPEKQAAAEEGEEKEPYADILQDPEYMAANRIYEKKSSEDGRVTLCFAGDILFDDEYAVMAKLKSRGGAIENGISETLISEMRAADIMMINNEFPYTNRGTPTEGKTYTFRADTDTVHYLDDLGVDLVSLANNHCYDFGETGLLDTLDTLQQDGIPYAGAGRNLEEAAAPVYFISGGMKIGFLSATQIERLDNPDTKGATEGAAGVFRCWNPEKLLAVTEETRKNCDFLVVYIHWGTENVAEADWAQLDQAPKIAQAGADLIIGDHPHCLQGIQYFGETPVFYSLGNFWFNSKTLDTCLLKVTLTDSRIESMTFIPAVQSGCYTSLAEGEEGQRVISYMNSLSTGVFIGSDGSISRQE